MAKTSKREGYKLEHAVYRPLDKQIMKRLYKYLEPSKYWFLFAICILVIGKLIEVGIPLYIGHITQSFLNVPEGSQILKDAMFRELLFSCLTLCGLLGVAYCFDSATVSLKSRIGQKAVLSLRTKVYEHIQRLPLQYFDNHPVGHLITRTIHDVEQIDQMFTESIVPLIGSIVLFFGMLVAIFILEWKAAVAFLFVMPLVLILTGYFRMKQRSIYKRLRAIVSTMNTFINEHLLGVMTIQMFGLENEEMEKFEIINEDHRKAYLKSVDYFGILIVGIDFLQSFTMIMLFVVLALQISPGESFPAGTFFAFSIYVLVFFRPMIDLSERYNVLQSAMAASERIFEVLDQPIEVLNDPAGDTLATIESIEFDNVWFAYEKENWVLKGISFSLRKNESVALVGITGAGKTTISGLLQRFYDHQKGSIRINGREIQEYTLESLRKQFSLVLQDPVIFSGTVADNISLYDPAISSEEIDHAIDYVNFRQFLQGNPLGRNMYLEERGKSLSVGQMQLLSLARAVANKKSMVILDEATANIDSGTEKIIQETLAKILKDSMALVIAHRLSTIKDVDRILVLHEGRVAESGTHLELLEGGGIYEKLYRLQFSGI